MAGRFYTHTCMRCCLYGLNMIYLVLALILITLPVYFKVSLLLTSWPINGGIIAAGVFLLLIAVAGLYGSWRQHQIILFFYMVILVFLFILLFAFSLAALCITKAQQKKALQTGWIHSGTATKSTLQGYLNCCGFENKNLTDGALGHPPCVELPCYNKTASSDVDCKTCLDAMETNSFKRLRRATGGVALFLSFSMFLGVYLAFRYRHLRNPKANPNHFL